MSTRRTVFGRCPRRQTHASHLRRRAGLKSVAIASFFSVPAERLDHFGLRLLENWASLMSERSNSRGLLASQGLIHARLREQAASGLCDPWPGPSPVPRLLGSGHRGPNILFDLEQRTGFTGQLHLVENDLDHLTKEFRLKLTDKFLEHLPFAGHRLSTDEVRPGDLGPIFLQSRLLIGSLTT